MPMSPLRLMSLRPSIKHQELEEALINVELPLDIKFWERWKNGDKGRCPLLKKLSTNWQNDRGLTEALQRAGDELTSSKTVGAILLKSLNPWGRKAKRVKKTQTGLRPPIRDPRTVRSNPMVKSFWNIEIIETSIEYVTLSQIWFTPKRGDFTLHLTKTIAATGRLSSSDRTSNIRLETI